MAPSILLTSLAALSLLPWTSFADGPKAVSLDFSKVKHRREAPQIARRGNDLSVTLDNARLLYLVDFSVGTPPQQIRAQIDTGSADLWVPHGYDGMSGGYLLSDSTTGFDANSSLNTVYGEGKRVTGEFIQDVLHMGGIEMNDVQFGWAATYNPLPSSYFFGLIDTYGIMGVGPEMLEAGPSLRNETPYPNIISNLKRQKFIAAEAFSLFLNTAAAPSGTILFGGVDSSKYQEPLISLPLVSNPILANHPYYAVQMTSITAQSPSGISTFASTNQTEVMYTVLDSGSADILLPKSLITSIYAYLGATWIPELNTAVVPCDLSTADTVFSFYFGGPGGPKINVPVSDLIQPSMPLTVDVVYADKTSACVLQIKPSFSYFTLLGDTFLRSAYVVYDLENKQIAMAQADLTSTAEANIQEIKPGMWGIPGVNTVMPTLPFNVTALKAGAPPATASAVAPDTQPKGAAGGYDLTLPNLPARASVTAVGPAGALFTGRGFSIPSAGMRNVFPSGTGTAAGSGRVGPVPTANSDVGRRGPSPTIVPSISGVTSRSAGVRGRTCIVGALVLMVGSGSVL